MQPLTCPSLFVLPPMLVSRQPLGVLWEVNRWRHRRIDVLSRRDEHESNEGRLVMIQPETVIACFFRLRIDLLTVRAVF